MSKFDSSIQKTFFQTSVVLSFLAQTSLFVSEMPSLPWLVLWTLQLKTVSSQLKLAHRDHSEAVVLRAAFHNAADGSHVLPFSGDTGSARPLPARVSFNLWPNFDAKPFETNTSLLLNGSWGWFGSPGCSWVHAEEEEGCKSSGKFARMF